MTDEDRLQKMARLIVCGASMVLYRSTRSRRMPPEIGSLVFETSARHDAEKTGRWLDHVGTYAGTETDTIPASADGEIPERSREWHILETFDGRRVRWDNCDFAPVPESWCPE